METKNDVLRGRFTAWIQVVVKRAKIDYIRKLNRQPKSVSLDTIAEDEVCTYLELKADREIPESFEFDDEDVVAAFYALSLPRQKILNLMFVQGKTAEQVASLLGCSVKSVFNEKSIALNKIREHLGRK